MQELWINGSFALAKLRIDEALLADFGQYILHPSIIDGALQTAAGLVGGLEPATPYLPFALDEVEIAQPVSHTCYAYAELAPGEEHYAGVRKFDIRLLSESGEVLVSLKNLFVRALAHAAPTHRPHGAGVGVRRETSDRSR